MRNGSRSEYYLVEGGLKLTRMRQSEWRRRWGVAGIQSFDGQVGSNSDGGWSNSNGDIDINGNNLAIGQAGGFIYNSWARFTNVTIPGGATVTSANISVNARLSGGDGDQDTNIYMSDEDNPAVPTTQAEHAADPRTTASTTWDDVDYPVDTWVDSPDISAVVQEILDRGGWLSGQAMMILWDDDGSPNGSFCQPYDYAGSPAKSLKLHVEYTT